MGMRMGRTRSFRPWKCAVQCHQLRSYAMLRQLFAVFDLRPFTVIWIAHDGQAHMHWIQPARKAKALRTAARLTHQNGRKDYRFHCQYKAVPWSKIRHLLPPDEYLTLKQDELLQ